MFHSIYLHDPKVVGSAFDLTDCPSRPWLNVILGLNALVVLATPPGFAWAKWAFTASGRERPAGASAFIGKQLVRVRFLNVIDDEKIQRCFLRHKFQPELFFYSTHIVLIRVP